MLLPGYSIESELHRGRRRVVCRARREADGARVILKALLAEYPTPAETASLRREFEILQSLHLPGVARAEALEQHDDRLFLILASAGDTTLKRLVAAGPLALPDILSYAIDLAAALAGLHRAGVVHKDVNANNVVVDS